MKKSINKYLLLILFFISLGGGMIFQFFNKRDKINILNKKFTEQDLQMITISYVIANIKLYNKPFQLDIINNLKLGKFHVFLLNNCNNLFNIKDDEIENIIKNCSYFQTNNQFDNNKYLQLLKKFKIKESKLFYHLKQVLKIKKYLEHLELPNIIINNNNNNIITNYLIKKYIFKVSKNNNIPLHTLKDFYYQLIKENNPFIHHDQNEKYNKICLGQKIHFTIKKIKNIKKWEQINLKALKQLYLQQYQSNLEQEIYNKITIAYETGDQKTFAYLLKTYYDSYEEEIILDNFDKSELFILLCPLNIPIFYKNLIYIPIKKGNNLIKINNFFDLNEFNNQLLLEFSNNILNKILTEEYLMGYMPFKFLF